MAKILRNEELDQTTLDSLSKDERDWVYNALDCCCTLEILEKQKEQADEIALNTYQFSLDLMGPILEMNLRGTAIDLDQRKLLIREFSEKRNRLAQNLNTIVCEGIGFGNHFNWRSHHHLKALFYSVLKLKPVKTRNSAGIWAPTVNRDALEKLQVYLTAKPICRHILLLRELDKKLQFIENELDNDGRMRTSFNIAGTNEGRLSSSESDFGTGTNEQNIERPLRRMFVPDPGMKFCNIDLEQADSRNIGAICWELFVEEKGEKYAGAYLDACESGDLHTTVAMMVWGDMDWPDDPKGQRALADEIFYRESSRRDQTKRLGHATNFLGKPRELAARTKIDAHLVTAFQDKYFTSFPCVLGWQEWSREQLALSGQFTSHLYARRRYFFGRPNDDRTLREALAYQAASMTADALNTGLIAIWHTGLVDLLIQVHDSILFQYPEAREHEIIPHMCDLATIEHGLKRGRKFSVPVEAKIGWNWADADAKNPSGLIKWKGPKEDKRHRPSITTGRPYSLATAMKL